MRPPGVRRVVAADPAELATLAAREVAGELERRPDLALLAATGNTPMGTYAELARLRETGLDTSRLRVAQLDEYLEVGDADPRSLYGWLDNSLLRPLNVTPERVVRFRGDAPDPETNCLAYDEAVARWGGLDLAVLGLGPNGHLGFNEPPSGPDAPTRVVTLTPESLVSNTPYWGGLAVPPRAVTAGMTTILAARRVLLLVSGAHKRAVLAAALEGPQTPELPASLLGEANLTVMADRAAWGLP